LIDVSSGSMGLNLNLNNKSGLHYTTLRY